MNTEELNSWLTSIFCTRMFDGSLINYIEHDYKDTFIDISMSCCYVSCSISSGEIISPNLSDIHCSPNDDTYRFYTVRMAQSVMGNMSAEKLIGKTIRHFIAEFGYMSMDVHVVRQKFKSSGNVNISVLVAESSLKNNIINHF